MRFGMCVLMVMGACNGPEEPECTTFEEVFVYSDLDGDGFGKQKFGWVCAPEAGQSVTAGDCDDEDGTTFPHAPELCDAIDNDCNGAADDSIDMFTWYEDKDGDTFGGRASAPRCAPPDPSWVSVRGDCDDEDPLVNPSVREVCNGYDDDCDRQADDDDLGVDPTTQTVWYRDLDGDGWGDDLALFESCEAPGALFITTPGDCDDNRPLINPDGSEVCNLRDDDCDLLIDDDDDSIDPAGQTDFFLDSDLDGYGDPNTLTIACRPIPGAVINGDDCDDSDATATVVRNWYEDDDHDTVGAGLPIANACHSPGGGASPLGTDCDDADPLRFPGNPEVCEDGFDQDCNGIDQVCATWLYTVLEVGDILQRWDAQTNTFEDVGPLGVTFDFGDLAYDEATSTMYMVDGFGIAGLYTVDLTTGAATLIGVHGIGDMLGLGWDPTTSTLYGSTFLMNFGIWEMNINTGAASFVAATNVGLGALTYDTTRDMLVGCNDGPGDLYGVNPANGALSFLGNGGFVNDSGLGYDPVGDRLYTIDWSGGLYQWDPTNNYVRSTLAQNLISHDGFVYVPDPPN